MPARKKTVTKKKAASKKKPAARKKPAAKKKAAAKRSPKLTKREEQVLETIFHNTRKSVDDGHVKEALSKTKKEIKKVPSHGFLQGFVRRVGLLYDVLKSGVKGEYKIAWKMIAAITAALIYFISPIDLIPDAIPIVGYLDDAFVILLCVNFIQEELLDYCEAMGIDPEYYGLVIDR